MSKFPLFDDYPPMEAEADGWQAASDADEPYPPMEATEEPLPILSTSFAQLRRELGADVSRLLAGD